MAFPDLREWRLTSHFDEEILEACTKMGVNNTIPLEILIEKIESLDGMEDVPLGHHLCLTLYKEINNQMVNGLIHKHDVVMMKQRNIFRDSDGNYCDHQLNICLNNDETLYQQFEWLIASFCVPFVSSASISKFCEVMQVKRVDEVIKFKEPIVQSVNNEELSLIKSKILTLVKYLNYYCKFRQYPQVDLSLIKIIGCKSLQVEAQIFESTQLANSKQIHTPIYALFYKNEIYVDVDHSALDIMKNKFFTTAICHFFKTDEKNRYELCNLIDLFVELDKEERMLNYFKNKGYQMDVEW